MDLTQRRLAFGFLFLAILAVSLLLFSLQQPLLKRIVLYFPAAGSRSIVSEVHAIPAREPLPVQIRNCVDSIVNGPLSMKYRRSLPAETIVRSVYVKENKVWVDFSASVQLSNSETPLSPIERLAIVKRSILFNFSEISQVETLIEGQVPGVVPQLPARKS